MSIEHCEDMCRRDTKFWRGSQISIVSHAHQRERFWKICTHVQPSTRECNADEKSTVLLSERIPCLLEYLASSWLGFSSSQVDRGLHMSGPFRNDDALVFARSRMDKGRHRERFLLKRLTDFYPTILQFHIYIIKIVNRKDLIYINSLIIFRFISRSMK